MGGRALTVSMACFGGCLLCVLPIVITAQRASMAAIVVYAFLALGVLWLRAPWRMSVVAVVMGTVIIMTFGGSIAEAYATFSTKSDLVGANMRFEEWAAVWGEISAHPLTLLFGQGWGASFSSPAVADINVNYTHSLLSSMLLKLGLTGFVLCGAYICGLLYALMRIFRSNEIIVMAIVAPILIDVFLYAAFKSLDFGLLLTLIPVMIYRDFPQMLG